MWRPLSPANIPLPQDDSDGPLAMLVSALPAGRLVSRSRSLPGWDGRVLLAAAARDW